MVSTGGRKIQCPCQQRSELAASQLLLRAELLLVRAAAGDSASSNRLDRPLMNAEIVVDEAATVRQCGRRSRHIIRAGVVASFDFLAVGIPVAVGVGVAGIDAELDFFAVGNPVAVGVAE